MKKFIFTIIFTIIASIDCFSQSVVSSYSMSYFGNNTFNIEATTVENNKFTYYIFTKSISKENKKCGFSLESDRIEDFIKGLKSIKSKFEEWTTIAKDNDVTRYKKDFNIKLPFVNCFWLQSSNWYFSDYRKLVPYFKVTERGKCYMIIQVKEVFSSTNQSIEISDWNLVFSNTDEIDEFIDAINPNHAIDYTNEYNKKDKLFK